MPSADRPAGTVRGQPPWRRPELLVLSLLVLIGSGLRLWILTGPLGEVEADESVVGLMALHLLAGEPTSFYWGQPYLGTLEVYLVAGVFTLFGPSNLTLKAVPGLGFLLLVLLVYAGARRDFGVGAALLAACYLLVPPSFLAFWSLKARGGYVELLWLGQLLFVLTGWAGSAGRMLVGRLAIWGLVGGLLLWTHLLGLVYLLPAALFLAARLGRRLFWRPLVVGLLSGIAGLWPALSYNLDHGWETLTTLQSGGGSGQTVVDNLGALARVGLPVLAGLAQATSSPILFAEDWPTRPGSRAWVASALLVGLLLALLPALPLSRAEWRRALLESQTTRLGGFALLALTPLLAALGRFGELVAEPRYALPLYAATPNVAYGVIAALRRWRTIALIAPATVLLINLGSLATADPRLNLPTTASGSTAANRQALIADLRQAGELAIYADYWLAYPLMFESREAIVAAVSSGGFNRYVPYALDVASSPYPAFVFISGSDQERDFIRRLAELGGSAVERQVGLYSVYSGVRPLDELRP